MHPILFEIGPVTIRSYGALVACAFLVGFALLYAEAKRRNFFPDKILDLELCIILSGLVGARALHVLVNLSYYRNNIFEIFLIWHGGLAVHGGLFLAILAGWLFILKNKMPLRQTGDLIAPYIALGQSIGRVGCFLNGCCYGKEAMFSFLGISFPGEATYRYPTQLYASLFLLLIFVILKIAGERVHVAGTVFAAYVVYYSMQRFLIDLLRDDLPRYAAGLTITQFIGIAFFVGGIFLLFRVVRTN